MAWVGFSLLAALAVVVVMVPGAQILWLMRIRDFRTVLLAPAVGVGLIGLLSFIAAPIGGWSWAYPLGLIALLLVGIVLQGRRERGSEINGASSGAAASGDRSSKVVLLWAAVGVGVFVAAYMPVFIAAVVEPGLPQTLNLADAAFHLTGAKLVADTGNVNPLTALAEVRTPVAAIGVYYPVLWHAIVALLIPFASVGMATNALMVAVGLVFWPLSLSALSMSLTRSAPSAAFWAPMLAVTSSLFPGSILFRWSMDPFGISVPLVASALAAAIWWQRGRQEGSTSPGPLLACFALIFIGAIAAQPSTALLIAIIPLVMLVAALAWSSIGALRRGAWGRSVLSAGTLLVFVAVVAVAVRAVTRLSFVQSLGGFRRAELGYWGSLFELARGGPTYPETATSFLPWAVICVVGAVWAIWSLRSQAGWIFSGTALAFLLIYMASSGPDNVFRLLTGPWYKDYTRLAVFVIALVAAAAGAAIGTWMGRLFGSAWSGGRFMALALGSAIAIFAVLSPVLGIGGPRASYRESIEEGYDLELDDDTVLSEDAAYLLRSLDGDLPAGSYILGVPSSGAAFAVAFSDQYGFTRWVSDPTVTFLMENIDSIATDPEVCAAVRESDVSAVLLTDAPAEGEETASSGGLSRLDTSEGFELIETRGDLTLWRITACD